MRALQCQIMQVFAKQSCITPHYVSPSHADVRMSANTKKSIQTSRSGPRSFYLWHTGGVPQHSRYLQWSRHVSLRFEVTHPHISIRICNCAMSATNEKPAMQCVVFTFRSQSSFANLYWSMVLAKCSYLSLASPSGATMRQRPQI